MGYSFSLSESTVYSAVILSPSVPSMVCFCADFIIRHALNPKSPRGISKTAKNTEKTSVPTIAPTIIAGIARMLEMLEWGLFST